MSRNIIIIQDTTTRNLKICDGTEISDSDPILAEEAVSEMRYYFQCIVSGKSTPATDSEYLTANAIQDHQVLGENHQPLINAGIDLDLHGINPMDNLIVIYADASQESLQNIAHEVNNVLRTLMSGRDEYYYSFDGS